MQRLHPAIARRRIFSIVICASLISCFAQVARTQQFETPIYTSAPATNSSQAANGTSPFERPVNIAPPATPSFNTGPQLSAASAAIDDIESVTLDVSVGTPPKEAPSPTIENQTGTDSSSGTGEGEGGEENPYINEFQATVSGAFQGDSRAQSKLFYEYLLPLLAVFAVMIVANWIGNYARRMVSHFVSAQVDETLGQFAGNVTKYAVMALAVVVVLGQFGVGTTGLAAGVAALGFAIGMALQGTLGNFAAGIALLVFRPFDVGDYICVADEEGTVREIALFTTAIDTHDNRRIIIPNESVFGNKIQNWTHNSVRRVDVLVGVSYDADTATTRQVLTNAISDIPGANEERGSQVYLCELNASSVDWSCRVWCSPSDFLAVKERVTEAVKLALDKNGIGIPYPQLDLHVIAAASQQRIAA